MKNIEINKTMAEFMGWTVHIEVSDGSIHISDNQFTYLNGHERNPCENISDAWMVVEHLLENGNSITFSMCYEEDNPFAVYLNDKFVESDSAPMAICLAALKMLEEK